MISPRQLSILPKFKRIADRVIAHSNSAEKKKSKSQETTATGTDAASLKRPVHRADALAKIAAELSQDKRRVNWLVVSGHRFKVNTDRLNSGSIQELLLLSRSFKPIPVSKATRWLQHRGFERKYSDDQFMLYSDVKPKCSVLIKALTIPLGIAAVLLVLLH